MQFTMYTVHCTLYTLHCTLQTALHCTLYAVQPLFRDSRLWSSLKPHTFLEEQNFENYQYLQISNFKIFFLLTFIIFSILMILVHNHSIKRANKNLFSQKI